MENWKNFLLYTIKSIGKPRIQKDYIILLMPGLFKRIKNNNFRCVRIDSPIVAVRHLKKEVHFVKLIVI